MTTINGTSGADLFRVTGTDATINGNGGVDIIDFEDSPNAVTVDLVHGTASGWGNYVLNGVADIFGSWQGGTLLGNDITNYIAAPGGNNTIIGGNASALLVGGSGNDTITGGAGNDTIVPGGGINQINGGGGYNTVSYSDQYAYVFVDLYSGAIHPGGSDSLANITNIVGSDYGNTLKGDFQDNIIIGGARADILEGREGNDLLTGGGGADTFVFGPGAGRAVVTDFTVLQGDKIDLSAFTAFSSLAAVQAVAAQNSSGTVIDLGGGASLTLQNVTASSLTSSDFVFASGTSGGGSGGSTGAPSGTPGQIYTSDNNGETWVGTTGADTFNLGRGGDTVTGGGGSDVFKFAETPWAAARITDFSGSDVLDLTGLLAKSGFTGSDPVGEGYIKITDDGKGDAQVWSNLDKIQPGLGWYLVTTLDHVAGTAVHMQGAFITG